MALPQTMKYFIFKNRQTRRLLNIMTRKLHHSFIFEQVILIPVKYLAELFTILI